MQYNKSLLVTLVVSMTLTGFLSYPLSGAITGEFTNSLTAMVGATSESDGSGDESGDTSGDGGSDVGNDQGAENDVGDIETPNPDESTNGNQGIGCSTPDSSGNCPTAAPSPTQDGGPATTPATTTPSTPQQQYEACLRGVARNVL